jgi:hypothetical protein
MEKKHRKKRIGFFRNFLRQLKYLIPRYFV